MFTFLFPSREKQEATKKVIKYEIVLILHEVFKRDPSVNLTCAHYCKPLHHRKLIPRRGFSQLLQVFQCIDWENEDGRNRDVQALQNIY